MNIKFNDTFMDKIIDFIHWYQIEEFFQNWIFPAYDLRNLLIHRHDRIKIPQVKPWKYTDISYFMLCANFEMIVNFIEKENPEKVVCWYKDENGEDVGHKYGETEGYTYLYPEYNGKYIMDIIKEIYNFWKNEYPVLEDEKNYLLSFWCDYIYGDMVFKEIEESDTSEVLFDKSNCPKTLEEFEKIPGIKWDIIDKYIKNRNDILKEHFVCEKHHELEYEIHNKVQKYLHLCIEVRPYLWT